TTRTAPQARGALCVLRHHVELPDAHAAVAPGETRLEASARAPQSTRLLLAEDALVAAAPPAAAAAHRPPVRQTTLAVFEQNHVANLFLDEPDAGNPHVRICGSPATATRRATRRRAEMARRANLGAAGQANGGNSR